MPPSALGPHVVGTRVVVRRVVPGETGPSGGPALTDVLGVCTAWGEGRCVVQPESGPAVTIPLADVVAGKPVPPRPSPRLRLTPDEAQRRGMTLFPGLETQPLGDWMLRRSTSYGARRANSVLAMAPSGLDPSWAYEAVVDFYEGHGQRPIAAVLPGTDADALFVGHGWVPESGDAHTVFRLTSVASVARLLGPAPDADVEESGDVATISLGDRASGVAAVDGDWAGYRSIVVAPEHRRQGLGLALMAALVAWSAERGATTAYLQVLADNAPALALYDRLGFVEHHRYRYLAKP